MVIPQGQVHEPDASLLHAKDAVADGARLRRLWHAGARPSPSVSLQVPLVALFDVLEQLDRDSLRQVVQRAEARLAQLDPA